jgi:hypothetical protein
MDPNATLAEIRQLVQRIELESKYGDEWEGKTRKVADMASRLAELIKALDEWLSKGGFRPSAWQQPPVGVVVRYNP